MRAMMVTTQGEDFITFADAKGLKDRTIFLHYAIRNALLPQATALRWRSGSDLRRRAGRGRLRLSRHRHGAVQRDPRLRLFLVQGIVFIVDPLDRPGDADSRSDLSAARPAHHLSEGLR